MINLPAEQTILYSNVEFIERPTPKRTLVRITGLDFGFISKLPAPLYHYEYQSDYLFQLT